MSYLKKNLLQIAVRYRVYLLVISTIEHCEQEYEDLVASAWGVSQ